MRAQSGAQIWPKTRFLAISQRGPLLVTKGHIWSHLVTLSSLGINHSWSLVMISGHIWAYLVTKVIMMLPTYASITLPLILNITTDGATYLFSIYLASYRHPWPPFLLSGTW